jgi:molybdopterin synthase sulfur carrier subunit
MAVRLVFLGKLADLAGAPDKEVAGPLDWPGLLGTLHGALGEAVQSPRIRLALNGQVLPDKTALAAADGDEVALLPPVSGG